MLARRSGGAIVSATQASPATSPARRILAGIRVRQFTPEASGRQAGSRRAEGCQPEVRQAEARQVEERQAEERQAKDTVSFSHLPIVTFSDDVDEMHVWKRGSVQAGKVQRPKRSPDLRVRDPIAMSPAYLGFAVEPYMPRILQYAGLVIVFARPPRGVFMQQSIDTVLLCHGLQRLFSEDGLAFRHAVDVGSGSGFVGKFAAVHAPGSGELGVTLCDVDPAAMEYSRSPGFGASECGFGGRGVSWQRHLGDATALLQRDGADFDLLISNPPYIPTRREVIQGHLSRPADVAGCKSFWEGVGLVVFLINHFAERSLPRNAHMVLVITSLTLKAPGVVEALEAADASGIRCRCLLEREVAWKAWYAGPQGNDYLLASGAEIRERRRVGRELGVFVGATPPGRGRLQKVADGRQRCQSYHWQVVYVLDFSFA